MKLFSLLLLAVAAAAGQTVETFAVVSQAVTRKSRLPGELLPYLKTPLHSRVAGFVEAVEVDRGSMVKKDQVLVKLSAPELAAQIAEAEAKARAVESQTFSAAANRVAAQSTYERLKTASATPGVVAANEVVLAQKAVDALDGQIRSFEAAAEAARGAVKPLRELQSFLEIKAPFDGIVTERMVHPGALVGPGSGALLMVEQQASLRLVVAVPEADAAVVPRGATVSFKVPAHPGRSFTGTVARTGNSLDTRTRTLPVEIDVSNRNAALSPGMYADVEWPSRRSGASLLVPPTAVVTTTERSFVIRVNQGSAEWVNVSKGSAAGDLVEVFGPLSPGDVVVRRASDEMRQGSAVKTK